MSISLQLNNQLSAVSVGVSKGSPFQVGWFKKHKNAVKSEF